jgi:hypothetical protein
MKKIKTLLLCGLFIISSELSAWGTTGHRVVAEIAQNHLSAKARRQLQKIIGKQSLAYWANWSDFIKSDPEWKMADSWHYLNIPSGMNRDNFDSLLNHSTDVHLYKRTLTLIDELKDRKNLSLEKQQQNLYFLIHLLGDAHQPLHLGREEDLGGNKIEVKWFRNTTNIHSLWDSKLIDFQKYSYTEYAKVLDIHDKKINKNLSDGNLEDWLFESYQKAEDIYAHTKKGDNLWYDYNYRYVSTLEEQLLKGGLRLAKILNEVFG